MTTRSMIPKMTEEGLQKRQKIIQNTIERKLLPFLCDYFLVAMKIEPESGRWFGRFDKLLCLKKV